MKLGSNVRDKTRPAFGHGVFNGFDANGWGKVMFRINGKYRLRRCRREDLVHAYRNGLPPEQEQQRINLGLTTAQYKDALR